MLFLLDTSVVAELRKAEPHAGVVAWLKARAPEDVGLAAATAGEMQAAVERARRTNAARANALETWLDGLCSEIAILPATGAIFRLWARLSAGLGAVAGIGETLCHTSTYAGNTKSQCYLAVLPMRGSVPASRRRIFASCRQNTSTAISNAISA